MTAQNLAYLGDAVFELSVRKMLLSNGERPQAALNHLAKRYVSAKAQAAMYHAVSEMLTDDERDILRRGRNAHPNTKAKNASMGDYRHATGLEALFGWLYLTGQVSRLDEVFTKCAAVASDTYNNYDIDI